MWFGFVSGKRFTCSFYFINVVSLDGPVDQADPPALHAECWDQSVHNHAQLATYFLK